MFLQYSDLEEIFPKSQGVKDDHLFITVSSNSAFIQPRGLFIPLFEDSGELKEAIQNGAIASVWDDNIELPAYLPNHFPILFSNDLKNALELIIHHYLDKLTEEKSKHMNMTKFLFNEERLLNERFSSYDKPVFNFLLEQGRRG